MEPDDLPVHDLLGAGDDIQPGPDQLRAIVARAGRRRLRVAGVGMAAALAVGGIVGYAVSNHTGSPTQTASSSADARTPTAGGSPSAGAEASSASASTSTSIISGQTFTRLFTRTAGPVTIRGFLTNLPGSDGVATGCPSGLPPFQAEVSTDQMVGTLVVFAGGATTGQTKPLGVVQSGVLGTAEQDPVAVIAVATGSGVSSVKMSFTGAGTDQMEPVRGWVALAAPVSAKVIQGQELGTLTALGASGKMLSTTSVTLGRSIAPALSCGVGCPPFVSPAQTVPPTAPGGSSQSFGGSGAANSSGAGASSSTATAVACPTCPSPLTTRPAAKGRSTTTSTSAVVNPGGPAIPASGTASASVGGATSVTESPVSGRAFACALTPPHPGSGAPPIGGTSGGSSAGHAAGSDSTGGPVQSGPTGAGSVAPAGSAG